MMRHWPDSGELVWYYQTTPGDNWDYTAVQQMVLADLTIDGRNRQVLMQAPKNGFFYVLDRLTGELISIAPPITYELDRVQYLAVLSGSRDNDPPGSLFVYALDGRAAGASAE